MMMPISNRIGALSFAVLLLVGGCAPRSGAVSAPEAAPAAQPLACREVEGLEPLLTPGSGVLLGEMHGTVESPAFLANAACLALRAGRPVTVALEIPREEEARVESFLGSGGIEADRAALLDSPFWKAEYQDGRRSEAMVALFDELRRLRKEGRPVRVKLTDRFDLQKAPVERDRWMGESLAQAFEENPGGVVLFLAGNIHSRISRGTPWDSNYEPAGFVLTTLKPGLQVISLDVSHQGGTAWFCTTADPASCQVRSLRGRGDAQEGRIVLHPQVTNGFSGVYNVGSLTASPPAAVSANEATKP